MDTQGARLVVLDVPPGITFGIDAMSYTTGKEFRGVRSIPPGLHFCHYSVGGGDEQQSNGYGGRHGFFFLASSLDQVLVWRWDKLEEDLVSCESESGAGARKGSLPEGSLAALLSAARRGDLDASLGPYPQDKAELWGELTSCISGSVLESCGLAFGVKVLPGCDHTGGIGLLDGGDGLEEDGDDDDEEGNFGTSLGGDYGGSESDEGDLAVDDDDDDGGGGGNLTLDGRSPVFPRAEPPRPKLRRKQQQLSGGAAQRDAAKMEDGGGCQGASDGAPAEEVGSEAGATAAVPVSYEPTKQGRAVALLDASKRTAWATDASSRVLALVVATARHRSQRSSANVSSSSSVSSSVSSGDRSSDLAVEEEEEWEGLLGEVQLAFVLFSLCFSLPALRHWKRRVALLSRVGPDAVGSARLAPLFSCLYASTRAQLEFVPSDFFAAEQLTHGNFLEPCMRNLLLNAALALQGKEPSSHKQQQHPVHSSSNNSSSSSSSSSSNSGSSVAAGSSDIAPASTAVAAAGQLKELAAARDKLLMAAQTRFSLFLTPQTPSSGAIAQGGGQPVGRVGSRSSDDYIDDDDDDDDDQEEEGEYLDLTSGGGSDGGDLSAPCSVSSPRPSAGPSPPALPLPPPFVAPALPGLTGFEAEDELPVVVEDALAALTLSTSNGGDHGGHGSSSRAAGAVYTGGSASTVFAALTNTTNGEHAPVSSSSSSSSSSPPPSSMSPSPGHQTCSEQQQQQQQTGATAAIALRYPALVRAVRTGEEDLLMAARRLVDRTHDLQQQQDTATPAARSIPPFPSPPSLSSSSFPSGSPLASSPAPSLLPPNATAWVSPTMLELEASHHRTAPRVLEEGDEEAAREAAAFLEEQAAQPESEFWVAAERGPTGAEGTAPVLPATFAARADLDLD